MIIVARSSDIRLSGRWCPRRSCGSVAVVDHATRLVSDPATSPRCQTCLTRTCWWLTADEVGSGAGEECLYADRRVLGGEQLLNGGDELGFGGGVSGADGLAGALQGGLHTQRCLAGDGLGDFGCEHELDAEGEDLAVHGDDERLGQLPAVDLPRVDTALGYMRDVALDVAGHADQIQAGGEHGPFAVQDARAQRVVGVEFAVGGGEFTQHGGVERVAFVRAVEADDLNVAVTADLQGFVGHGFFLSGWVRTGTEFSWRRVSFV